MDKVQWTTDDYTIQIETKTITFKRGFTGQLESRHRSIAKCLRICFEGSPVELVSCFNNSIYRLPNAIESIIFNAYFNKSIHRLPSKLNYLIFGACYNTPVKLSKKICYLDFGRNFNQPLELVRSLRYLKFGSCFDNRTSHYPRFLRTLIFGHNHCYHIIQLPQYLHKLVLGFCNSNQLIIPEQLEILTINLQFSNICIIDNLPHGLKTLRVQNNDGLPINNLHSNRLNNLKNAVSFQN